MGIIHKHILEVKDITNEHLSINIIGTGPLLHKRFKGVEKAPLGIWYDFIHCYVPKNKAEWYK